MESPIWKTPAGRDRLISWYDKFASKIEGATASILVPTSLGLSNVLVTGPENGPALICLHGMRTGASFLLSELGPLSRLYRLYAPDIPGQSIRGLEQKLSLKDDSYANWLVEILDGLDLTSVSLFGVSWGGYVALATASIAPNRVSKLSLLSAAGISNGSHVTGLIKMAFPLMRHSLWPTENSLRSLLNPILTTWDADWARSFDCALRDMKMDYRVPPLATDSMLKQLRVPTLVLAGDSDISFPGVAVTERACRLVPNVQAELIAKCRHCPPTTEAFREWLCQRLNRFLLS